MDGGQSMTDDPLRKRIAQTAEKHGLGWIDNARCYCGYVPRLGESWHWHVADAVIVALGRRRCGRCKLGVALDHFPPPHQGSDVMRPYCIPCTRYVEWATS